MLRPQYHFTAGYGWLNDPNGMVYDNGEYHLFFQHNPTDCKWGNIHWGHAVSRDLLHWQELGEALTPPSPDDLCFSGSAVIDHDNTAGFGAGAMVLFFTSTGRGECVAYSTDRGRTFTEYEGNPVIRHDGRDPKVVWHPASGRWIMAVYDECNYIAFYSSANLREWKYESKIHGFFECPDLFPLGGKWVLTSASGIYSVGNFDGHEFVPETLFQNIFTGDNYAGQSFSNLERRVMIFWLRCPQAETGAEYSQQMSLPVELRLHDNKLRVTPAVTPPGMIRLENTGRPLQIHGKTLPPARSLQIVEDVTSTEVFVNDGEAYHGYCHDFQAPRALVFGEILYDIQDGHKTLGGAPLNLAVQWRRLGAEADLISAVGDDEDGRAALESLSKSGIGTAGIAVLARPTGKVTVTLDGDKVPAYSFAADTAFDHIPLPPVLSPEALNADVFCYGTLAQRGEVSRNTLQALRSQFKGKFFCDLNLRQDFFNKEIIAASLEFADIAKLNVEEMEAVAQMFAIEPDLPAFARRFSLEALIVTNGAEGCDIFAAERVFHSPGVKTEAVSTVGAGDAFSAAFLYHYFSGSSPEIAAAAGNTLAAMTVSRYETVAGL